MNPTDSNPNSAGNGEAQPGQPTFNTRAMGIPHPPLNPESQYLGPDARYSNIAGAGSNIATPIELGVIPNSVFANRPLVPPLPQARPLVANQTSLRCPFCLTVFPNGVAGLLTACPVCAAVGNHPETPGVEHPGANPSLPAPTRWKRTGSETPVKLAPAPSSGEPDAVVPVRRRRTAYIRATRAKARMRIFIFGVGLIVLGVLAVNLARHVYSLAQASVRAREDNAKILEETSQPAQAKPPGDTSPAQNAGSKENPLSDETENDVTQQKLPGHGSK